MKPLRRRETTTSCWCQPFRLANLPKNCIKREQGGLEGAPPESHSKIRQCRLRLKIALFYVQLDQLLPDTLSKSYFPEPSKKVVCHIFSIELKFTHINLDIQYFLCRQTSSVCFMHWLCVIRWISGYRFVFDHFLSWQQFNGFD